MENESPVEEANDETEKEEEVAAPNWAWEPEEDHPEENAREEYEDDEDDEGLST